MSWGFAVQVLCQKNHISFSVISSSTNHSQKTETQDPLTTDSCLGLQSAFERVSSDWCDNPSQHIQFKIIQHTSFQF